MFGVQLYKNMTQRELMRLFEGDIKTDILNSTYNARALLPRILSILNLDWLQHARSVRGVYELTIIYYNHHKIYIK